jgi:hypothetical protein
VKNFQIKSTKPTIKIQEIYQSMIKGEEFPNKKQQTHNLNIRDQSGMTKGEIFLSKKHQPPPPL